MQRDDHGTVEDYVTIIGRSGSDVMHQFTARGLDRLGYAIVGRIVPQTFALTAAEGSIELFEGSPMLAATFRRAGGAGSQSEGMGGRHRA